MGMLCVCESVQGRGRCKGTQHGKGRIWGGERGAPKVVGCADGWGWVERTQTREEGFGELTLPSPPFQPRAQPGFTCAANEKQIERWDGLETGRLALLRGVLQLVPSLLPVC